MSAQWTGFELVEVNRAVVNIRNAIIEARALLSTCAPLLAVAAPEEVRAMRVALIDADTALLRIKARMVAVQR